MSCFVPPVINHIDEVLEAVEGCDEFVVRPSDFGFTTITYTHQNEDTFPDIVGSPKEQLIASLRREARGIKFDQKTGKVVARPFHKFFNVGERNETQLNNIDFEDGHHCLVKLDGSLIHPVDVDGTVRLCTKAGITDVSRLAERLIATDKRHDNFMRACIQKGVTPIFEYCSLDNRIVIEYAKANLTLIGIRDNVSGQYLSYGELKMLTDALKIRLVSMLPNCTHDEDFVKNVRSWTGVEGVVLVQPSGERYKIKTEDYVTKHRVKSFVDAEYSAFNLIVNNSLDDVLPMVSETHAKKLTDYREMVWEKYNETVADLITLDAEWRGKSNKEFSIGSDAPKHLKWFVFKRREGKSKVFGRELLATLRDNSTTSRAFRSRIGWFTEGLDW